MDFASIFDVKFVFLCLIVTAVTHVVKACLSPVRQHKIVKTVILPSAAIVVGAVAGYLISTLTVGLVAGLLSSLIYSKVRAFIRAS